MPCKSSLSYDTLKLKDGPIRSYTAQTLLTAFPLWNRFKLILKTEIQLGKNLSLKTSTNWQPNRSLHKPKSEHRKLQQNWDLLKRGFGPHLLQLALKLKFCKKNAEGRLIQLSVSTEVLDLQLLKNFGKFCFIQQRYNKYFRIKGQSPLVLTCETAHASSGFSSRSNENSIRTLQAAATDCNWFLGTEKSRCSHHSVQVFK